MVPPIKELIHEEFGDGIMSAIEFSMTISREADSKGDRVCPIKLIERAPRSEAADQSQRRNELRLL